MADDDRYRWLDEKVAERLLHDASVNARSVLRGGRPGTGHGNGEGASTSASVHPGAKRPSWARGGPGGPDHSALDPAERLAAVLEELVVEQTAAPHAMGAGRAAGAAAPMPVELPGEDAAVEAFRAVHADSVHSGAGLHGGPAGVTAGPADAGTLVGRRAPRREGRGRAGRRPGGERRASLAGRPLRAGFAMAVAGCALGGAAVAAGAGVLPTPFGGGGAPAASVSPLASPSGDGTEATDGGSPYESNGPRRGTREGGGGPSGSPSDEDTAGSEDGRGGSDPRGKGGKEWPRDNKDLTQREKKALARALCVAYNDDQLSLRDRLWLEQVAGGRAGVEKFCGKYGSGSQPPGGVGGPGGAVGGGIGGDGGSDGGNSDGGSSDGGNGDSGGSGGNGGDASGGIGTPGGDASGSDGSSGSDGIGGSDGTNGQLDTPAPESDGDSSASTDSGDSAQASASAAQSPSMSHSNV